MNARSSGPCTRAVLTLLLLASPAAATATEPPPPLASFTAEYRVSNGSLKLGRTTIELQPREQGWRYHSETEATGLLALVVHGKAIESTLLEPHGDWMRPVRYEHREPDEADNVTVDFDWASRRATARHADGSRELDLDPETVDTFSATLELVRALADGDRRLRIPTIDDSGEHETLIFERVAQERIEVPLGTFDTIRVERVRRDSDRETITWLAPALNWVAVRIDQRDDGELEGRLLLTDLAGPAADGLARASAE